MILDTITFIAAVIWLLAFVISFYHMKKDNQKMKEYLLVLESKSIRHSQITEILKKTNLEGKLVNSKLERELQYWQLRRKVFEDPSAFRKKKIREKKRRGKHGKKSQ
jgi:hypothetical protein